MSTNRHTGKSAESLAGEIDKKSRGPLALNKAQRTEEGQILFNLEPEETSLLRDFLTEDNGAAVAYNGDDTLDITTDGSDGQSRGTAETAALIDYTSGLKVEGSIGLSTPENISGIIEWGIGEDTSDNKAHFRESSDNTLSAVVKKGGVETEVVESKWSDTNLRDVENENGNVDFKVIGYGNVSDGGGLTKPIDTSLGYRYVVQFIWYGYGPIVFHITYMDPNGKYKRVPLVAFVPTGGTSIEQPNQPVFATADNDGSQEQQVVNIGGRQGGRTGKRDLRTRKQRHIIQDLPTIGTSYETIAVVKRSSNFLGVPVDVIGANVVGPETYDIEIRGRVEIDGATNYSDFNRTNDDEASVARVDEDATIATDTSDNFTGEQVGGEPTEGGSSTFFSESQGTSAIRSEKDSLVREKPAGIVGRDITGGGTPPDEIQILSQTTY